MRVVVALYGRLDLVDQIEQSTQERPAIRLLDARCEMGHGVVVGEVEAERRRLVERLAPGRDQGRHPAGRVDREVFRLKMLVLD